LGFDFGARGLATFEIAEIGGDGAIRYLGFAEAEAIEEGWLDEVSGVPGIADSLG
jgi:hypothetical protein